MKTPWLYRIERPGRVGEVSGYLFGTVHLRSARVMEAVQAVRPALEICTTFAAEIDFNDLDPAAAAGLNLAGTDLADDLGQRDYHKMRRLLLRAVGLDLDHYRRLPPLMISGQLREQLLGPQLTTPTLDEALHGLAVQSGKGITGLESVRFQLDLLRSVPRAVQVQQLKKMTARLPAARRQLQRSVDRYLAGEERLLYRQTRDGLGNQRRALLYDRNRRMTLRLDELLQDQTVFAAVGAAHLPGGKGMLRLLKQAGWVVRNQQTWS
ncbi:MAG: TraB/GumN family protein [Saprospiraceae bacterium]